MKTLIMKFGGSSVGTTSALTQVLSIVLHERERWKRLMIVVSALEGVTDALLEAAHLAQLSNRRGYRRIVATLRTRHLALVDQLPFGPAERAALQTEIDRRLFDMLDTCQALADRPAERVQPESIDAIIGVGERLSARIVAALLRQNALRGVAIDATDVIVTDSVYGNATPNLELSRARIANHILPMLDRAIIPVITGFIGATTAGQPTTLGRGGSDYTASVLGVCSDADEIWIWSDVDGMMSADPRDVDDAHVIPTLSYTEVAELAYFGARVLHPRMVAPLRSRRIPVYIKNVYKPQQAGTLITEGSTRQPLKAVTSIAGLALSADQSGPLSTLTRLVDEVFFETTGSHADVMIASQSSEQSFVCFIIPTTAGPDALHTIKAGLEEKLRSEGDAMGWTARPVTVITAIGSGLGDSKPITTAILDTLEHIRVLALGQGPTRCSFSVVVEVQDGEQTLNQLHRLVISSA